MCDKGRIVGIADYNSGDAFCTTIGMECVGWNGMSAEGQIGREMAIRGAVHFSSTSCLWPGFVRSATVLLNSDMNWP